jgi:predicted nucleic acid-binding protein
VSRRAASGLPLVLVLFGWEARAQPVEPSPVLPLGQLLAGRELAAADRALPAPAMAFVLPHVAAIRDHPLALGALAGRYRDAAESSVGDAAALLYELGVKARMPDFRPTPPAVGDADLARVLGRLGCRASKLKQLPPVLRAPVARLLSALLAAEEGVARAWRAVPLPTATSACRRANLVEVVPDGSEKLPDVEEAARGLDAEATAGAALTALGAVESAVRELRAALLRARRVDLAGLRWEVKTKHGRVRVAGTGNDRHVLAPGAPPFLLVLDLGGDDTYEGAFASASWPERPVSVAIDLSGNDVYRAGRAPAQGSGIGGIGILWEDAGDDRYAAESRAQGWGQLGVGVLVDQAGRDDYRLGSAGQGAAIFGAGLLLDRAGGDRYEILDSGQGHGGPGGCGSLVDASGDDVYLAVREPGPGREADPRTGGRATTSNAQGAGVGRRADLSDGRSWAGGIGALVDLAGNDSYTGGTFCQGAGFWHGTGILADASGDDTYDGVWYAQGSAAHFALGVLLDAGGNDRHVLSGTGGAGLGFGWDAGLGMCLDLAGDDAYAANRLAVGAAGERGIGVFADVAGSDRYVLATPAECAGYAGDAGSVGIALRESRTSVQALDFFGKENDSLLHEEHHLREGPDHGARRGAPAARPFRGHPCHVRASPGGRLAAQGVQGPASGGRGFRHSSTAEERRRAPRRDEGAAARAAVRTAVDSSVLLDVLSGDEKFGEASRLALKSAYSQGPLLACDIVWAEVSATFSDDQPCGPILARLGLQFDPVSTAAAERAGRAWRAYRARKGSRKERMIADFLIGAHALDSADALLSRDRGFFRSYFPELVLVDPSAA